jgi:hypothetical protein
MSDTSLHAEWLSLLDVSGPFLALPVLNEALPQGVAGLDADKRKLVRQAYAEWCEAFETEDKDRNRLHDAWIDLVVADVLSYRDAESSLLKREGAIAEAWKYTNPDHCIVLTPDYVLTDGHDKPLLSIVKYSQETELDEAVRSDRWAANPIERMVELCRATGIRLGLVTNGERWALVDATLGVTSVASWYARLWLQEPIALQAFVDLLGVRRFFAGTTADLPALLDRSLSLQDEVTDALGEQVRRAVEVLVQSLDRADQDRNRELLNDVSPAELYEAGLTIMMRIVFLLSAEERGLLLMGDETYEANYAASTLRLQLRNEPEEILERRWDAWSRLLSLFRAIYAGIEHDALRLPALGGSLFDPDRFPFLEGRAKGSDWKTDVAVPLPIDNRTVLLLLEAVQLFQGRALSYLALDVEQIGYVYEGLLERTVVRAAEVTLELAATKSADNPWIRLSELDDAAAQGKPAVQNLLQDRTGSSAGRIKHALAEEIDETSSTKLLAACDTDQDLCDRIRPYFHLLRTDSWGYPLVYPKGTFMVARGSDRRETGTHYTPKSFTELIVKTTLEPLVYDGPSNGADRTDWKLKSAADLLDLKICDPAMGSGAFLVQVCRYLGERLVEAWDQAEVSGKAVSADGDVLNHIGSSEPMSTNPDERQTNARRLIAERSLYGVDMNPLAVELAKLSIWLVTLAKGRPFGFLDHNFRRGDSLLGITKLEQLEYLDINFGLGSSKKLFASEIDTAVADAIELRKDLRSRPIRDIRDIEYMAALDERARIQLEFSSIVADALLGEYVVSQAKAPDLTTLSILAGDALSGTKAKLDAIESRAFQCLNKGVPSGKPQRRPFHWPLEFPEVFERGGFDGMVGNPPFIGNKYWKDRLGADFQSRAKLLLQDTPGKIDLCVIFHRRVVDLVRPNGTYGLLATDNIAEGVSVGIGLGIIVKQGDIFFSKKGIAWPGSAAVSVSIICFFKGEYRSQKTANGASCDLIGPRLQPVQEDNWEPRPLKKGLFSFEGVHNGKGLSFIVRPGEKWFDLLGAEKNSLLVPYISGEDITTSALHDPQRWALDIADRSFEQIVKEYPVARRFLSEVVKPTRTAVALKSYKGLIDRWWQFWNHRADLMRRIRRKSEFIAFSKNTTFPFCMLAPSNWIYTNKVVLIGIERGDELALCLSSFFRIWLETYSGARLRGWLTISINDSIATFPRPPNAISKDGVAAAKKFSQTAKNWTRKNNTGLTNLVSAIHSAENADTEIVTLRDLLSEIDSAVLHAYEWTKLDLSYDFRESHDQTTNVATKYEISEVTRAALLQKLVELNRKSSNEASQADKKPKPADKRRFA